MSKRSLHLSILTYGLLFVLIVIAVTFFKSVMAYYYCYNYYCFSSLWRNPVVFFRFYLPHLSFPLLLGGLVVLFKRKTGLILFSIFSLFLDLWLLSNIIYFKANDTFLTIETICMASNMSGTWSSVFSYFHLSYLLIPFTTIISIGLLVWHYRHHQNDQDVTCLVESNPYDGRWTKYLTKILFSFCMLAVSWLSVIVRYNISESNNGNKQYYVSPIVFYQEYCTKSSYMPQLYASCDYVKEHALLSYFGAMSYYWIIHHIHKKDNSEILEIDESLLMKYLNQNGLPTIYSDKNLIVILVESLESWTLSESGVCNNIIAPNLIWFSKQNHVKYFPKVKSQVLAGTSGDAQMIVTTGLLPISQGAACMDFGANEYPSLAKSFRSSIIVNPWPHIWNQDQMNQAYGYKLAAEPDPSSEWNDFTVVNKVINFCRASNDENCGEMILGITSCSHTPFSVGKNGPFIFPSDIPSELVLYMNAIHYVDSALGFFFKEFQQNEKLREKTIIILGDHTVFKRSILSEYAALFKKYDFQISGNETFIPLIIYSPDIEQSSNNDNLVYQMDIYPTLLNLMGIKEQYWKGFGCNLLDDSIPNRSEQYISDCYMTSDRMIRSNFFNR